MRTESSYIHGHGDIRILDVDVAVKFGVTEAHLISQIQYWVEIKCADKERYKESFRDDRVWVYNTYEQWQEQLPFFSKMTIRRAVAKLESEGVLITANYNTAKYDKTKWYSIDYDALDEIMSENPHISSCVQNEQTVCSIRTDDEYNLNRPIPETTTDNTAEITDNINTIKNNSALILQDQCLYIDNNEVVGGSVFSEKENPTRKNTPVEETKRKPFKWKNDSDFLCYIKNIVPRQIRQYCRENDHMDDYETLLDFVMDYFVKYKEATGKGHPPYKENMFTEVFDSLYEYFHMFDYDTLVGCAEVFFDRASIKGRELKVFATENMLKYLYAELMCDYHEIMFE